MEAAMTTNTTNPNLFRRCASAAHRTLILIATVSAPIAAVYGHLAWVEAKSSSSQEEERLVLQRAMLTTLERMLPEAERTRLGIERLAQLIDRRLESIRRGRMRPKAKVETRPDRTSALAPMWGIFGRDIGPSSPQSKKAEEIFREMDGR
jgi:hypothetical protein